MSLIITATDFTDTANNAVGYACMLAMQYEASVVVIHSYHVPVSFDNPDAALISEEESRKIADKQMWKFMDNLTATFNTIAVNGLVMFGDITENIAEYAEGREPWLIVVGNSLSEKDGFWNGTNLLRMMRKLKHTVVAVPDKVMYRTVDKVCLAYDYRNIMDEGLANAVKKLVKSTGAELHILNIENSSSGVTTEEPIIAESIHYLLADEKPQFHFIQNEDTEKGINDFVNANHMDWLVVQPHKHNLLEQLFHKSETKALAHSTTIPLVSLHG